MNQYRVDLWIENEGDIPDLYFQLQMNVEPVPYELIEAVMLLARCWSVRKVEICRLTAAGWSLAHGADSVTMDGYVYLIGERG